MCKSVAAAQLSNTKYIAISVDSRHSSRYAKRAIRAAHPCTVQINRRKHNTTPPLIKRQHLDHTFASALVPCRPSKRDGSLLRFIFAVQACTQKQPVALLESSRLATRFYLSDFLKDVCCGCTPATTELLGLPAPSLLRKGAVYSSSSLNLVVICYLWCLVAPLCTDQQHNRQQTRQDVGHQRAVQYIRYGVWEDS